MNPIVYHIAGGGSFFTGVVLIGTSAGLMLAEGSIWKRLGLLSLCIGLIAVSVSSAPLPFALLTLVTLATIVWLGLQRHERWQKQRAAALVCVWIVAAFWESNYWLPPRLGPVDTRAVTIVGDSLTAGMGMPNEVTWPALLARQHGIAVQDLSGSGFTTSQALARAEFEGVNAPLVIVEIGGNDMLHGRSSAEFRRDLDALLMLLTQNNRQVVMLELPLLPFYGNYGRVQRTLAKKHGVLLVPKRVLLNIIAAQGATRDSIHLTNAGHQAMADEMWRIVSPAYEKK